MRKLLSLILAVAMIAGLSVSSFAAGNGYSTGSDATTTPPYTPTVTTEKTPVEVTKEVVTKNVEAAIAEAITAKETSTEVVIKDAVTITPEAFKTIVEKTAEAKVTAVVHADTMVGKSVASRWYIDPVKAAALPKAINLSVSTTNEESKATKKTFEKFFDNKFAVVSLGQKGSYGMDMDLAIKVDLKDIDVKTMSFMSYDNVTNKFVVIKNPKYFIDKNGYLHFTTPIGGDIIITNGSLKSK